MYLSGHNGKMKKKNSLVFPLRYSRKHTTRVVHTYTVCVLKSYIFENRAKVDCRQNHSNGCILYINLRTYLTSEIASVTSCRRKLRLPPNVRGLLICFFTGSLALPFGPEGFTTLPTNHVNKQNINELCCFH